MSLSCLLNVVYNNLEKKMKRNFIIILSSAALIFVITTLVSFSSRSSAPQSRTSQTRSKTADTEESLGCGKSINYSGVIDEATRLAVFEGREVNIPEIAFANTNTQVLGAQQGERWVEVDISEQKLRAWQGDTLFLESPVSTGLPWWPTPLGEFRVWIKLRATKMEGGSGSYYYYLPNVPYVMFFENSEVAKSRGYSLHGAYWHNEFGTPRSHGCVNLPIPIAEQLYHWSAPILPEGKSVVYAAADNPGMRVVIHE